MMAEFHSAALVSRSRYCARWLSVTLSESKCWPVLTCRLGPRELTRCERLTFTTLSSRGCGATQARDKTGFAFYCRFLSKNVLFFQVPTI